ncbi:hypothetical protein GCM10010280_21710 [Streptomyces pilosus]|uniref:Putative Flp pilus-assembly TadG-like N-terminal domain-containing protein n=1 Tax=Streptomyces pilosus TaxID=28893 RepID=A0A918EW74_9ACTN|nr:hypothetical protein GCM10010280_21710 [Streptomyces pilosus]
MALADRGSATVWSVGAIAVLCVVFGIVLALGHAVVVRHRAAGGADLAALAAADHWAEGRAAACARADRVARRQDARLVRCALTGEVADVSVASGHGPFTVEVRARAGPAAGPPEPPPPPGTAGVPSRVRGPVLPALPASSLSGGGRGGGVRDAGCVPGVHLDAGVRPGRTPPEVIP